LQEKFKNEFGHSCEFIARAPGRVNLIGKPNIGSFLLFA
jgi:galactokinase